MHCPLVSEFLKRFLFLSIAVLLFLAYTWARWRFGFEQRDWPTFAADATKNGLHQALGAFLALAIGVRLGTTQYDPLAWYGATYPFDVVLSTFLAAMWRRWTMSVLPSYGKYGEAAGEFRCGLFIPQLVQSVFLISLPARLMSLGSLALSLLLLPPLVSPVAAVARAWFYSGLECGPRGLLVLYAIPLVGDALGFIIIDGVQRFRERGATAAAPATSEEAAGDRREYFRHVSPSHGVPPSQATRAQAGPETCAPAVTRGYSAWSVGSSTSWRDPVLV